MKRFPLLLLHFGGAILFAIFAFFQVNDIDPAVYYRASSLDAALWCAFYLLIAVLFVVAWFRRLPSWLLVLAALACLAEMILTGPGLWENLFGGRDFTMTQASMNAEDPRVELTREFAGAVIALLGVGVLWWRNRARKAGAN